MVNGVNATDTSLIIMILSSLWTAMAYMCADYKDKTEIVAIVTKILAVLIAITSIIGMIELGAPFLLGIYSTIVITTSWSAGYILMAILTTMVCANRAN